MSTSNLLVPINLDALVVNNNNHLWKDLSLDIDRLKEFERYGSLGYYLEKKVIIPGQSNTDDEIIAKGIHLHWTLPDGFRKGVYDDDGSLKFPAAPNRWLVIRMHNGQKIKTWVIESDRKSTDPKAKSNWLMEDQATRQIKPISIGRWRSFGDFKPEDKTGDVRLTIMAPGNPDFAASYMHCKNVFGFHDDMKADSGTFASGTKFTYQVFGWFADEAEDPLKGITSSAGLTAKLKDLSWTLQNAAQLAAENIPDNIICHAMIRSVVWEDNPAKRIPKASDLKIGIGNSTSEAMATMLRDLVKTDKQALPDKLLAAFQYQSLVDHGAEGDGLNLMRKKMHARSFQQVNGGTKWVIERKEKKKEGDNRVDKGLVAYDTTLSAMLSALNDLQSKYDKAYGELQQYQAELYAHEYKEVFLKTNEAKLDRVTADEVRKGLVTAIAETKANITLQLKTLKTREKITGSTAAWPDNYTGEIPDTYGALQGLINKLLPGYLIKETPVDPFFEPADPAIIIAGLNPLKRYSEKDIQVKCRVKTQIANKLKIGTIRSITGKQLAFSATANSLAKIEKKVPDGVIDLIYEAMLLDPLNAKDVAALIGEDLGKVQTAMTTADPANYKRENGEQEIDAPIPPSYAISNWQQPWNPMYLEWSLTWDSSYKHMAPTILSNWRFGDKQHSVDFKYKGDIKLLSASPADEVVYHGRTLLSSQLANKISELNTKIKDSGVSDGLFNESLVPMSQTLSGFGEQLLMRYHGLQLPILDKAGSLYKDHELINGQNAWRPMVAANNFYPVRSGKLTIAMLRVVDSFGQVLDVFTKVGGLLGAARPLIKSSAGLPTADADHKFELAPRIVQPAKLKFDWISAAESLKGRVTDSDPATSPVCGWLLYNQLEKSISVYNVLGQEMRVLSKKTGKAVESALPPAETTEIAFDNSVLQKVFNYLQQTEGAFQAVQNQMIAVTDRIQSKASRQQLTMTLPIGFPLAIVTGQFEVALKASPAKNQAWLSKSEFVDIEFKANIGNAVSKVDGLAGYFLNNDYNTLLAPSAIDDDLLKTVLKASDAKFKTRQVQKLTLLMDPRTEVNIATGILPAYTAELPQQIIEKALKVINLRFMTAPVITPVEKVTMPLLRNNDTNWGFVEGTKTLKTIIPETEKDQLKFKPIKATEGWVVLTDTADRQELPKA